jgi:transcriptional regulator with XRE-family HTH domain
MSDRKTTKRRAAHKSKSRSVGSLDVHFGEKLRARSQMLVPKLSQDVLGKALGVLYQQVSKYEKDINRMSTALMMKIAALLKVDVRYFFDDRLDAAKNHKEIKTPALVEMSVATHGPRLIEAFLNLKSDKLRGVVADLAQALKK